jgi:hypothetical protein
MPPHESQHFSNKILRVLLCKVMSRLLDLSYFDILIHLAYHPLCLSCMRTELPTER